ncbi:hypothetical protein [Streptomyces lavendulae]|uniref:hypothetical protein n=1 Tax=Streptomyces lavendulae TaxID=1914 RepID=UPI0024A39492|nr:hypothetical protein [Streptomyces lavendulae]GLX21096.1 hypothetical protein Slala01_47400 [Streptomyces lavendulae subsp. lavendulae]GLX25620.1 hypothetical protein Slala02_14400 [Streptomyces lavendulae subsp. lavendulae]
MNQRTRTTLFIPLAACSLALGPATAAWAVTAAPHAAPAAQCFVEPKAGDATKVTVTGEGFDKAKGKVKVDRTDGDGGTLVTPGADGKFTATDQPAGKYEASQVNGPSATCLAGQEAQDAVNKNFIDSERKRGTREGFTDGKELAQAGVCDAEAKPKVNNLQGLTADNEAKKKAQEAYKAAYTAAFDAAINRYCTD